MKQTTRTTRPVTPTATDPGFPIRHADLGNGQATYARIGGHWYSVNHDGRHATDIRWPATPTELETLEPRPRKPRGPSEVEMRFAFSLAIDLPRTLPRPLAYLLTPEELRTYLERQLDRADIPPAAFKPDHWLQLNAVYRAAAGEDPDPDPSRKDSLIHQLADTLAAAVARVTLAHAEGDPILYAWIPSARAALLAVRAANIPRTAADDDRRDHGTACASCGCPLTDPDSPFCEDCEDLDPADRRRLIEDQIRDAEQASAPVDSMEGGATR